MAEFIERRKHPRVPLTTTSEIYKDSLDDFLGYALIRNVSLGGMGIETTLNLEVGKNYTMRFALPDGKMIKGYVRVVWKHPALAGGILLYGVQFLKIGLCDRLRLEKYIKKELKKQPPIK